MSIKLFSHNQSAFASAPEMLDSVGKAAVVHPTGTGKSYIGFKLCETFPDKTVCRLSPSEYIYQTQLENLKRDSDGLSVKSWLNRQVKCYMKGKMPKERIDLLNRLHIKWSETSFEEAVPQSIAV